MWPQFKNLIWHSVDTFLARQGTTGLGFVSPIVIVLLSALLVTIYIWKRQSWQAVLEHWAKNLTIVVVLAAVGSVLWYGALFAQSIVITVYEDHQKLVSSLVKVRKERDDFKSQKDILEQQVAEKDSKIRDLQGAISRSSNKTVPLHTSTVEFGFSGKVMVGGQQGILVTVVGLTNKSISPVNAILSCDRPIEMEGQLVIGGQQTYIEINKKRLDPKSYEISTLQPPWTPESPLGVRVFTESDDLICDIKPKS